MGSESTCIYLVKNEVLNHHLSHALTTLSCIKDYKCFEYIKDMLWYIYYNNEVPTASYILQSAKRAMYIKEQFS